MGMSGGLVPCPEALGVMVLAVGVNRIARWVSA
jgi:ABC-type nickel/cobalt efflux system permease component RcnA